MTDRLYLGRTTWRQTHRLFGVSLSDRRLHTYILGKTGVGKSSLIEGLARQDATNHRGFALIDPHGDLADRIQSWLPAGVRELATVINVPDPMSNITFNPLERVIPHRR